MEFTVEKIRVWDWDEEHTALIPNMYKMPKRKLLSFNHNTHKLTPSVSSHLDWKSFKPTSSLYSVHKSFNSQLNFSTYPLGTWWHLRLLLWSWWEISIHGYYGTRVQKTVHGGLDVPIASPQHLGSCFIPQSAKKCQPLKYRTLETEPELELPVWFVKDHCYCSSKTYLFRVRSLPPVSVAWHTAPVRLTPTPIQRMRPGTPLLHS